MGKIVTNVLCMLGGVDRRRRLLAECLVETPDGTFWSEQLVPPLPPETRISEACKLWGCCGHGPVTIQDDGFLSFDTVLMEPARLLRMLSERYPDLELRLEFENDAIDTYGQVLFKGGDLAGNIEWDFQGECESYAYGQIFPWLFGNNKGMVTKLDKMPFLAECREGEEQPSGSGALARVVDW